jgi:hypothetical protein
MTGGSWRLSGGLVAKGQNAFTGSVKAPKVTIPASAAQALAFGTGSGRCDLIVVETRTLAAGVNESLNLYDGSLIGIDGLPAPFRKLKGLFVWVSSDGDAAGVTIGSAGTNPHALFFGAATHTWTIFPGGPGLSGGNPAGVTVDATHNALKVLNNGAVAVTYGVALAGTSV